MLGGKLDDGFEVSAKYIGNRRLIEIAISTLATDRALLLLGVPGTAKTWVSEHLAAAISGDDKDDLVTFPHTKDSEEILHFLTSLKLHAIQQRQQTIDQLNSMFTRQISKSEFADVVDATFPAPAMPKGVRLAELMPADMDQNAPGVEYVLGKAENDGKLLTWQQKRMVDMRTELGEEYSKFNRDYPYAANTAYAAWNAATATINHSDLFTGAADKQMVSLFFGQKRKMTDRAWAAVSELD